MTTQQITLPREVVEAALEALSATDFGSGSQNREARLALRAALQAQPAPPVGQREAFEAWFEAEYPVESYGRPKYQNSDVMMLMFAAWQAAQAQPAPDVQEAVRLALEALTESRDDVCECLNTLMPNAGYERYDKRITGYQDQLIRHDAAIAALEKVVK